jgi:hypothetical protein
MPMVDHPLQHCFFILTLSSVGPGQTHQSDINGQQSSTTAGASVSAKQESLLCACDGLA